MASIQTVLYTPEVSLVEHVVLLHLPIPRKTDVPVFERKMPDPVTCYSRREQHYDVRNAPIGI